MTGTPSLPEDIAAKIADHVLGLMSDEERQRFEKQIAADPELRRAVAAERERFLEIDTAASPLPVPPGLWSRIEAGLGTPQPAAPSATVTDLATHRSQRGPAGVPTPQDRPRRTSASFWQGFAAASLMAVIAAGAAWPLLAPPKPRLIVVLLDAEAKPVSIVEALDGQRIRIVPLGAIDVPDGRILQVWTLPSRDVGPVSMGLLPRVAATTLEGPVLPAPKPDQLYEITLEPAGGSPTGKPTGPIIGKGFAKVPQI